jgi:low affinity Fe/Cu permease
VDDLCAHPVATAVAAAMVVGWAIAGPRFHFSDTWQLVMNTTSSVITFLMVFIIANAQKRYTEALNIKLDSLIALQGAFREKAVGIEFADETRVLDLRTEIAAMLAKDLNGKESA